MKNSDKVLGLEECGNPQMLKKSLKLYVYYKDLFTLTIKKQNKRSELDRDNNYYKLYIYIYI